MIDDRDPALKALFNQASQELEGNSFTNRVMSRIDSARRWSVLGWAGFAIAFFAGAALLAPPLVDAVGLLSQVLPRSIIDVDNDWLDQLLSPVNSVAGLVALGFLGLRAVYRKIFAR